MCRDGYTRAMVASVLVLGLTYAVQAQQTDQVESGAQWLEKCRAVVSTSRTSAGEEAREGPCLGWIKGMLDLNTIYYSLGALERTPEGFCPASTVTVGDAASAAVSYMEAHPYALHFSARMLTYMALRHAFPCRRDP